MTRTLIAGFGNVLRGDDGFGVEVLRRLGERGIASDTITLLDVGTGGIRLAQELITPYDRLVIIDTATRGSAPGTVYCLIVDGVLPTREIDMHTTVPSRALEVAQAFGPLPAEIYLVGCEPESVDELTTEFTPVVAAAVDEAVRRVEELLGSARPLAAAPLGADAAGSDIAREDELFAVKNACGESPLPLDYSTLDGAELRCSWHGCRYDVRTGHRLDWPGATQEDHLTVLPVRVNEGVVQVVVGTARVTVSESHG